ncbi:hypothetical protein [Streptomyces hirsutus]|nr:hypothetical protein [Streptomyces hirsutus]
MTTSLQSAGAATALRTACVRQQGFTRGAFVPLSGPCGPYDGGR